MHSKSVQRERDGTRHWVRVAKVRLAVLTVVAAAAFLVGVAIRDGSQPDRTSLDVTTSEPKVTPSTPARPIPGLAHFADNLPLVESITPATGRPREALPR